MRLNTVPAARGAHWVGAGWRAFARKPLAFTGLFAFFLFIAMAAMLVPWVGPVLMLTTLPLVSLGFMIATREAQAGRFPAPGVFIAPLRGDAARRRALIRLGLIYAAASVVIMLISQLIDDGRLSDWMQLAGSTKPEDIERANELAADPRLMGGLLTSLTLISLLAVPFWHAPALVHWAGQGVAQSLFSSTLALWRNRGAFAVYMLAWTALLFAFSISAGILMSLLGARQMIVLLALPAGLTFSTVFYASLYYTFEDCFSGDEAT